jgi:membrane protein implicated in regulation of membrane protease activity
MASRDDNQGSAGTGPSRGIFSLALGEVTLLWLGALVGPMLVASAVAGSVWGLAAGLIVGLVCLALLLAAAVLVRRSSPQPSMKTPTSTKEANRGSDRASRLLIAVGEAASRPQDVPIGIRSSSARRAQSW